jgi:hypothetical protein
VKDFLSWQCYWVLILLVQLRGEMVLLLIPECGFPTGAMDLFSKLKGSRKVFPDLAKYTIWEGTPYAPMVDDIREMSFKGNANGKLEAQFELLLLRLIRRIIRYSRDQKFAKNSAGQDRFAQMILHNSMLQYLAYSPAEVCAFNSFRPYLYGSESDLRDFGKNHSDSLVCNSMIFLTAFAYLHFGTAMNSDNTKFSLDMGGQCIYTSRDIFYALVRILTLIVQGCESPLHPADSAFGNFPYAKEEVEHCFGTPSNVASPLLCMPLTTLLCFVVTSGAVAVFQQEKSPQAEDVFRMAHDIVLPAMEKIHKIWPSSENYSGKLRYMLRNCK